MAKNLIALAQEQAALYRLLSNPRRLMILWSRDDGEMAVGEIAERVGTTMQNISQHLRLLKEYELIAARRDGHYIYYRINNRLWLDHCMVLTKHQRIELHNERSPKPHGGI